MTTSNNDTVRYKPYEDFANEASRFQQVKSNEDAFAHVKEANPNLEEASLAEKAKEYQLKQNYPCVDSYHNASIQDNHIFIATTEDQHNQIANGENVTAHGGLSGYFSDQATVDACKNEKSVLDNSKYNELCQIAPHRGSDNGFDGQGSATYKPHIDCFEIDRNKLQSEYGTRDFNAAISKCEANNQFGSGGGNQGYNPYINQMVDNGCLKYNPDKSYSDRSVIKDAKSHRNSGEMTNSIVSKRDYDDMMADAQARAQDCINNNTPHPSSEACNNGFPHNPNPIESNTGNAIPIKKTEAQSSNSSSQSTNIISSQTGISEINPRSPNTYPESLAPSNADLKSMQNTPPDLDCLLNDSTKDAAKGVSAGVGEGTANAANSMTGGIV